MAAEMLSSPSVHSFYSLQLWYLFPRLYISYLCQIHSSYLWLSFLFNYQLHTPIWPTLGTCGSFSKWRFSSRLQISVMRTRKKTWEWATQLLSLNLVNFATKLSSIYTFSSYLQTLYIPASHLVFNKSFLSVPPLTLYHSSTLLTTKIDKWINGYIINLFLLSKGQGKYNELPLCWETILNPSLSGLSLPPSPGHVSVY